MADATGAHGDGRAVQAVVRAHRFELVDAEGRLRMIVGEVPSGGAPGSGVEGVVAIDKEGRARAWLVTDDGGASLELEAGGNVVASFGVTDPTPDVERVGAYLTMCDLDGAPVLDWQARENGTITAEFGRSSP